MHCNRAIVLLLAALAIAAAGAGYKPAYTADGKLMFPADYRQWQYVSSGVGMSYQAPGATPPRTPGFSNIFVQPWAYREFEKTGRWPDKTIFVLEAYRSGTHASINKQGYFQDSFSGIEAEVKDPAHSPDVWSYYNFGTGTSAATAFAKDSCWECHEKNAAVEHSFSQFYPRLLDVALAKNTIKPGVYIAPNVSRIRELIVAKGWDAAETALQEAKRREPEASIFDEASLNALGYQLIAAKHPDAAVKVMQRVTRDYPDSINALDSLADAFAAAGRSDQAIETSRTLLARVEKTPPNPLTEALAKAAKERIAKLTPSAKD